MNEGPLCAFPGPIADLPHTAPYRTVAEAPNSRRSGVPIAIPKAAVRSPADKGDVWWIAAGLLSGAERRKRTFVQVVIQGFERLQEMNSGMAASESLGAMNRRSFRR